MYFSSDPHLHCGPWMLLQTTTTDHVEKAVLLRCPLPQIPFLDGSPARMRVEVTCCAQRGTAEPAPLLLGWALPLEKGSSPCSVDLRPVQPLLSPTEPNVGGRDRGGAGGAGARAGRLMPPNRGNSEGEIIGFGSAPASAGGGPDGGRAGSRFSP
eukprot:CAMPEP_0172180328 /NCGR_PEP_ID=MMETSP1050-20130122/17160_1 /TAXON_ID=233186 /ORGANISM="Cryptomonas curvata, Strain CCAP979/52" /LENGTH=154 /DNA_ID=CAMNT_0012853405 /DNA_START=541 /DNA_END=1001 /DNA_ORIENTATION=+